MVRFKNRYLLFEIIYADTPLGWTSIPAATTSAMEAANQSMGPDQSVFGDTGRNNCRLPPISSKDLINIFRTSIGDNFGDYGAGITQRGLVCKFWRDNPLLGNARRVTLTKLTIALPHRFSEILFTAHQPRYLEDIEGRNAYCMGSPYLHQRTKRATLYHQSSAHLWYGSNHGSKSR